MVLSQPFCRIGSKVPIRCIIKSKSPSEYTTYIEPFVGSGAIYFYLDLNPETIHSKINDIDTDLITGYEILKSNPVLPSLERYKNMSLPDVHSFVKMTHNNPIDKLVKIIYNCCGTFGSKGQGNKIYRNPNIEPKLRRIPLYAEYMKNTTILNDDWKSAIEDNSNTFIYLDPPYDKSKGLYKDAVVDFKDMAEILSKLKKSKWLLSINDTEEIREIFKDFEISGLNVVGQGNSGVGLNNRNELLISNY